jgi:hypothetical protein
MAEVSERINTPISTQELERRWAAVRAAMAERKPIRVPIIDRESVKEVRLRGKFRSRMGDGYRSGTGG